MEYTTFKSLASRALHRKVRQIMKAILTKADIERFDNKKEDSNIRLIEMIVDGICADIGHQAYCMQFFYDLAVYGHKEALSYLDNFVQKTTGNHPPLTYAERFAKLSQVFVKLQNVIK